MGVNTKQYASALFILELEGTTAGFLRAVEGGEPFGEVVNEPVDASGVVKKHIGSVSYQPIVISFGTGMGKSVYQWMADVLDRKPSAKSGAIIFADYNYKERSRLEFDKALITEIGFPALDAKSKDAALFRLTLQPQVTRVDTTSLGTSIKGFSTKSQKRWFASNFRLKVNGLETACAKTNAVEALVITQPPRLGDPNASGLLNIPNLLFTVAESSAQDILNWANDFLFNRKINQASERSGTLEFLEVSLKAVLFTLKFSNLGVIRVSRSRTEENASVIARLGVELYCEQMSFIPETDAIGNVTKATASQGTTNAAAGSLSDTLVNLIAGRVTPDVLQVLNAPSVSPATAPPAQSASELIARRLITTVRSESAGPLVPKWDDGVALGEQWAANTATIDELNEIKTINKDDWSALKLESGHSLIDTLRDQGMVPEGADGPIQLERDAFVEGLVAGALHVLNNATPHLTRLSPEAQTKSAP